MVQDTLENEYFEWLYRLVCSDEYNKNISYKKLLHYLNNIEFTYLEGFERDQNRYQDGIELRYRYGIENNYSATIISKYLNNKPCSILEMMIALASRGEQQFMQDPIYGDRTGQWFWYMIVSLGLGKMTDYNFDPIYIDQVILRFLSRTYEPDGHGGLFIVNNPPQDLRTVEIWYQFIWYLNSVTDY